jgi:VanZ family protein
MTAPAIARRLDPWAPPIALMVVIFLFSAQPHLNSGLGTIDLIGRKIVHASEYALLTFLWWRALRSVVGNALPLAFAIAVTYAATDEFHQRFVSGRHGTPVDIGIDAAGALIAVLLIRRRRP